MSDLGFRTGFKLAMGVLAAQVVAKVVVLILALVGLIIYGLI